MGVCVKICAGDLNKQISVLRRTLQPPRMGLSASESTFETIETPWSKIVTVRGSRRYNGVNIDKSTTHLFECRYQPELMMLDGDGEIFISLENVNITNYYKVLEITNVDEQNVKLIFQCTNRGDSEKEGSNA